MEKKVGPVVCERRIVGTGRRAKDGRQGGQKPEWSHGEVCRACSAQFLMHRRACFKEEGMMRRVGGVAP